MAYPPDVTAFAAGQRLDAADLNEYASLQIGWGLVGFAQITANSSSFSTVADVSGLSVTFTAIAARYYVVSFHGQARSTSAGDQITMYIADGSDNVKQAGVAFPQVSNTNFTVSMHTPPLAPGAGSQTYKIRGLRELGVGTCIIAASGSVPAVITVMDVGATS